MNQASNTKNSNIKFQLKQFGIANILCIINTISSSIIQYINDKYQVSLTFSLIFCYFVVMIIPLIYFMCQKQFRQSVKPKQYMGAALSGAIDVIANMFNIMAFEYSDVASILLILNLSTPFSALFSRIFLLHKYNFKQVCLIIATVIITYIYTAVDKSNVYPNKNKQLGNLYAFLATLCYGFASTVDEKFSQDIGYIQWNSLMCLGAVPVNIIFLCCVERKVYKQIWAEGKQECLYFLIPYSACMVLFYFIEIYLTKTSSGLFFNASLLCSNIYGFISIRHIINVARNYGSNMCFDNKFCYSMNYIYIDNIGIQIKFIKILKKIYVYAFFIASLIPLVYIVSLVMLALPLVYTNIKNMILGRYKNNQTVNDYYNKIHQQHMLKRQQAFQFR